MARDVVDSATGATVVCWSEADADVTSAYVVGSGEAVELAADPAVTDSVVDVVLTTTSAMVPAPMIPAISEIRIASRLTILTARCP